MSYQIVQRSSVAQSAPARRSGGALFGSLLVHLLLMLAASSAARTGAAETMEAGESVRTGSEDGASEGSALLAVDIDYEGGETADRADAASPSVPDADPGSVATPEAPASPPPPSPPPDVTPPTTPEPPPPPSQPDQTQPDQPETPAVPPPTTPVPPPTAPHDPGSSSSPAAPPTSGGPAPSSSAQPDPPAPASPDVDPSAAPKAPRGSRDLFATIARRLPDLGKADPAYKEIALGALPQSRFHLVLTDEGKLDGWRPGEPAPFRQLADTLDGLMLLLRGTYLLPGEQFGAGTLIVEVRGTAERVDPGDVETGGKVGIDSNMVDGNVARIRFTQVDGLRISMELTLVDVIAR